MRSKNSLDIPYVSFFIYAILEITFTISLMPLVLAHQPFNCQVLARIFKYEP